MESQKNLERELIRYALSISKETKESFDLKSADIECLVDYWRSNPEQSPTGDALDASNRLRDVLGEIAFETLSEHLRAAAAHKNRISGDPLSQMKRELQLISFGIRVLELRRTGMGLSDAMHLVHEETGADAITTTALRKGQWDPFVDLVQRLKFVPYWSVDPETGALAPTKFVPSDLPGTRGRPKTK